MPFGTDDGELAPHAQRETLRMVHSVESEADFLWCVLCERTFRRRWLRGARDRVLCPYAPCEGGKLFEPWEWSRVREVNQGYPPLPVEGEAYPFFGR